MKLEETPIAGAHLIGVEPVADSRGSFGRIFDRNEFERRGLEVDYPQWSVSQNPRLGTLRGLHLQVPPHEETKLVRCSRGAIFDVLVDLRHQSPTYLQWWGIELTSHDPQMLYVPTGVAHGFQTLVDDVEVSYYISTPYHSDAAAGIRWDDPAIGIAWPLDVSSISKRDAAFELVDKAVPQATTGDPPDGM